jgi:ABC-type transport system substrate-binding protein
MLPVLYSRPDDAIGAAYTYRTTKSVFPVGTLENYLVAKGTSQLAVMNWDTAHAAVANETDPAKREAMFKDLAHKLKDSYAMIPVFYASALFAAGKTVTNWVPVEGWPSIGISYDYLKPAQ